MATRAELETMLAKLIDARSTGLRSVEYSNRKTEYKTDSEMASAIVDLERRIASLKGGRVTTVHIHSSKGT